MQNALGGYKEISKAYEKAGATVVLQSMCYKYLGDSANSKLYLKKAFDFFEIYAEAEESAFVTKNTDVIYGTPGFSTTKMYPPSERKKLEAIARKCKY